MASESSTAYGTASGSAVPRVTAPSVRRRGRGRSREASREALRRSDRYERNQTTAPRANVYLGEVSTSLMYSH